MKSLCVGNRGELLIGRPQPLAEECIIIIITKKSQKYLSVYVVRLR